MTKNALEKRKQDLDKSLTEQDLKEKARHNREQEAEARRMGDSNRTYNKVHSVNEATKNFIYGLKSAADTLQGNDFAWYTKYYEMIMSQLKQSIRNFPGTTVPFATADVFQDTWDSSITATSGKMFKQNIVAYTFTPTIGTGNYANSATSIAVKDFNTAVRGDNSGSTNYDAVDLFKYPLAIDSPSYLIQWILRGIALANFKEARNPSTVVYGLLKAHCFGNKTVMQMFITRRSALIDLYNDVVADMNCLNIPFNIPYFLRHQWLSANIFVTNKDTTATSYILCNPSTYHVYNEESGSLEAYEFAGRLTSVNPLTPDSALNRLREIFSQMLVPLTNSQAMATMSGDIRRAFGEGIKYPFLDLSSIVKIQPSFVTDTKYLQSFKNATIVDCVMIDSSTTRRVSNLDIHEGTSPSLDPYLYQGLNEAGINVQDQQIIATQNNDIHDCPLFVRKPFIDSFDVTHITEEDQCYNLSFTAHIFATAMDSTTGKLWSCRSEVLTSMIVYTFDEGDSDVTQLVKFTNNFFNVDWVYDSVQDLIPDLTRELDIANYLSQCDFIPPLWFNIPETSNDDNHFILVWNRNYNRNQIDPDLLGKIQRSALLSMFSIANSSKSGKERKYSKSSKR